MKYESRYLERVLVLTCKTLVLTWRRVDAPPSRDGGALAEDSSRQGPSEVSWSIPFLSTAAGEP